MKGKMYLDENLRLRKIQTSRLTFCQVLFYDSVGTRRASVILRSRTRRAFHKGGILVGLMCDVTPNKEINPQHERLSLVSPESNFRSRG